MMPRIKIICFLLLFLFTGGCIIIRSAAETKLTAKHESFQNKSILLAFKDAYWAESKENFILVGRGFHPREHETYAFFICEPYPFFQPRFIRITSCQTHSTYNIEMRIDASFFGEGGLLRTGYDDYLSYECTTDISPGSFLGKKYFKLDNIKLKRLDKPLDTICLSGKVVARKKSFEKLISMSEKFDRLKDPRLDK